MDSSAPSPTLERDRIQAVEHLFDGLVRFSRCLKSRSGEWGTSPDLTRGDIVTLGVLEARGSIRPGQVAAALNVDPSVISRQLVTLAKLDLITRGTDPEDGRAELITITPQGRERLVQAREAVCLFLAERLHHWDVDEIARATAMVEDLSLHLYSPTTTTKTDEDTHV
jgi:DNA-binding MarR family transcriptional regulator